MKMISNNYLFPNLNKLTIMSAINTDGVVNNTRDVPSNITNDLNRFFSAALKYILLTIHTLIISF